MVAPKAACHTIQHRCCEIIVQVLGKLQVRCNERTVLVNAVPAYLLVPTRTPASTSSLSGVVTTNLSEDVRYLSQVTAATSVRAQ